MLWNLKCNFKFTSIDLLPEAALSSIVSIPTEAQTFRSRGFVGCDLFWIFLQVLHRSDTAKSSHERFSHVQSIFLQMKSNAAHSKLG